MISSWREVPDGEAAHQDRARHVSGRSIGTVLRVSIKPLGCCWAAAAPLFHQRSELDECSVKRCGPVPRLGKKQSHGRQEVYKSTPVYRFDLVSFVRSSRFSRPDLNSNRHRDKTSRYASARDENRRRFIATPSHCLGGSWPIGSPDPDTAAGPWGRDRPGGGRRAAGNRIIAPPRQPRRTHWRTRRADLNRVQAGRFEQHAGRFESRTSAHPLPAGEIGPPPGPNPRRAALTASAPAQLRPPTDPAAAAAAAAAAAVPAAPSKPGRPAALSLRVPTWPE
jgi:hypothetical protein